MASKHTMPANRKDAECVRCHGTIQAYAGRKVEMFHDRYAHQSGQCSDVGRRSDETSRSAELQGTLFAWRCEKITVDMDRGGTPDICHVNGWDRSGYAAHMKAHGKTPLTGVTRIKPRKSFAKAALSPISVDKPFKWIHWTHKTYSEWEPGTGQVCTETPRRGQYWAEADGAHCIWVVPFDRQEFVRLYHRGDGTYTPDWSEAASARRTANGRARDRKRYASQAA
jgi:hypothetical protein